MVMGTIRTEGHTVIVTIILVKTLSIVIGILIEDLVRDIMAISGCILYGILTTLIIIFISDIDEIFENPSSLSWW